MILDDIFDNYKANMKISLTVFHFAMCMLSTTIKITLFEKSSLESLLETLLVVAAYYGMILFAFMVVHKNREERDELKLLNCKLIDYSFKERDYLISEERSRISQELHDSLGHLLMALSMNVKYLSALDDKEKIKEELLDVSSLVDESIKTLRSTVYSLKKLDENFNLYEELISLISKFISLDMIKINLNYDHEIENIKGSLKNILLVTVKEAVTNSLKHGLASIIDINIKIDKDHISLKIHDNGVGCKNIEKSTGLLGISDRFLKAKGKVSFKSSINKGFFIEALLPLKAQEGGFLND